MNIPIGSKIIENNTKENSIIIQIPNTPYYCEGVRTSPGLWDIYFVNPQRGYRKRTNKDIETACFSFCCNMFLKLNKTIEKNRKPKEEKEIIKNIKIIKQKYDSRK